LETNRTYVENPKEKIHGEREKNCTIIMVITSGLLWYARVFGFE